MWRRKKRKKKYKVFFFSFDLVDWRQHLHLNTSALCFVDRIFYCSHSLPPPKTKPNCVLFPCVCETGNTSLFPVSDVQHHEPRNPATAREKVGASSPHFSALLLRTSCSPKPQILTQAAAVRPQRSGRAWLLKCSLERHLSCQGKSHRPAARGLSMKTSSATLWLKQVP